MNSGGKRGMFQFHEEIVSFPSSEEIKEIWNIGAGRILPDLKEAQGGCLFQVPLKKVLVCVFIPHVGWMHF